MVKATNRNQYSWTTRMVLPPRTILVAASGPGNFSPGSPGSPHHRLPGYSQLSNTQSLQVQPVSSQLQPSPR